LEREVQHLACWILPRVIARLRDKVTGVQHPR
jgi:hypothetical protein